MFSCRDMAKKVQKATRNRIQLTISSEIVASVQIGLATATHDFKWQKMYVICLSPNIYQYFKI